MSYCKGISFSIECCDADRSAVAEAMQDKFAGANLEFTESDVIIPEVSSVFVRHGHSIHGMQERFEDGTCRSIGTEVFLFGAQSLLTSLFQSRIWEIA